MLNQSINQLGTHYSSD